MAGRRPTITPEKTAKIVEAIRAGNYKQVAAVYGGVSEKVFYSWMANGRKQKSGIYREFYLAVSEAEAYAEAQAVVRITLASKDDWRASAWLLERSKRTRWGAHISVDGMRELSDEQLTEIIAQVSHAISNGGFPDDGEDAVADAVAGACGRGAEAGD